MSRKNAELFPCNRKARSFVMYLFVIMLGMWSMVCGAVIPYASAGEPSCGVADTAFNDATRIRGLAAKKKVPCFVRGKDEVRSYLKGEIAKQLPDEKIKGAEIIYKSLGFVPETFDYKTELVSLYLGQLAGYYDPERKHYVMASWLPDIMQPVIAVHEMAHALQDQHFNLQSILDNEKFFTDKLLARMALIEGDATAVMNDYQREGAGMGPIAELASIEPLIFQTVLGSFMTQGLTEAPPVLKNLLIFPYVSGLRFVHAELRKGGYKRLNDVFRSPPRSTEEILHPEIYDSGTPSFRVVGDDEFPHQEPSFYEDSLGEFLISLWLTEIVGSKTQALEGSRGWGGDRIKVSDVAEGYRLQWVTLWDSEADAAEFHRLASRGLEEKKIFVEMDKKDTRVSILINRQKQ